MEAVEAGEMPLPKYLITHPDAEMILKKLEC